VEEIVDKLPRPGGFWNRLQIAPYRRRVQIAHHEDRKPTPVAYRTTDSPFLNGEQFDQETLRILDVAFVQVCIALRIEENSDDDVKQAIANKIIELAKTGERNPDQLCEHALKDVRQPEL